MQTKHGNNVYLTEEDAVAFTKYMQHRDKILTLISSGMFELPSGKVEINVNNEQIQSVYLYHMTYKRQK